MRLFARNGEKVEYSESLQETFFGHIKPNTIKRMPMALFSPLFSFSIVWFFITFFLKIVFV